MAGTGSFWLTAIRLLLKKVDVWFSHFKADELWSLKWVNLSTPRPVTYAVTDSAYAVRCPFGWCGEGVM